MGDVRLIDANSVCKKIVESIRCAEEWANEAREQQDTIGLQYASNTYSSLISMLERIQNESTVEVEPMVVDKEVRLIDANALKEDFMNDYNNYMMESLRGNHCDVIRISEVIERIEDAPTIETKLVKHGRWLDNGMVYTCSECHSSVPKNIFVIGCDFKSCPYCFARMESE